MNTFFRIIFAIIVNHFVQSVVLAEVTPSGDKVITKQDIIYYLKVREDSLINKDLAGFVSGLADNYMNVTEYQGKIHSKDNRSETERKFKKWFDEVSNYLQISEDRNISIAYNGRRATVTQKYLEKQTLGEKDYSMVTLSTTTYELQGGKLVATSNKNKILSIYEFKSKGRFTGKHAEDPGNNIDQINKSNRFFWQVTKAIDPVKVNIVFVNPYIADESVFLSYDNNPHLNDYLTSYKKLFLTSYQNAVENILIAKGIMLSGSYSNLESIPQSIPDDVRLLFDAKLLINFHAKNTDTYNSERYDKYEGTYKLDGFFEYGFVDRRTKKTIWKKKVQITSAAVPIEVDLMFSDESRSSLNTINANKDNREAVYMQLLKYFFKTGLESLDNNLNSNQLVAIRDKIQEIERAEVEANEREKQRKIAEVEAERLRQISIAEAAKQQEKAYKKQFAKVNSMLVALTNNKYLLVPTSEAYPRIKRNPLLFFSFVIGWNEKKLEGLLMEDVALDRFSRRGNDRYIFPSEIEGFPMANRITELDKFDLGKQKKKIINGLKSAYREYKKEYSRYLKETFTFVNCGPIYYEGMGMGQPGWPALQSYGDITKTNPPIYWMNQPTAFNNGIYNYYSCFNKNYTKYTKSNYSVDTKILKHNYLGIFGPKDETQRWIDAYNKYYDNRSSSYSKTGGTSVPLGKAQVLFDKDYYWHSVMFTVKPIKGWMGSSGVTKFKIRRITRNFYVRDNKTIPIFTYSNRPKSIRKKKVAKKKASSILAAGPTRTIKKSGENKICSLCGLFGFSEKEGRKPLERFIKGYAKVITFKKTNGQKRELFGVKIYSMEFTAVIKYISDKNADAWTRNWMPMLVRRKGERYQIKGVILFEKTENGWRPNKPDIKHSNKL